MEIVDRVWSINMGDKAAGRHGLCMHLRLDPTSTGAAGITALPDCCCVALVICVLLQVDLLSLDNLPLVVSFKTERAIRPRWANQMWVFNTLGDMLNLEALQLTLPGLELEGIKAPRSALLTYALKQLQAQALGIAFNVFRSGSLAVTWLCLKPVVSLLQYCRSLFAGKIYCRGRKETAPAAQ